MSGVPYNGALRGWGLAPQWDVSLGCWPAPLFLPLLPTGRTCAGHMQVGRMPVAFLGAVSLGCLHGEGQMGSQAPSSVWFQGASPGKAGLRASVPGEAEKGVRGCAQLCVTRLPHSGRTGPRAGQGPEGGHPSSQARESTGLQPVPKAADRAALLPFSLLARWAMLQAVLCFRDQKRRGGTCHICVCPQSQQPPPPSQHLPKPKGDAALKLRASVRMTRYLESWGAARPFAHLNHRESVSSSETPVPNSRRPKVGLVLQKAAARGSLRRGQKSLC